MIIRPVKVSEFKCLRKRVVTKAVCDNCDKKLSRSQEYFRSKNSVVKRGDTSRQAIVCAKCMEYCRNESASFGVWMD